MNIDDVVDDVINVIVNLTSVLLLSISKLSHVHTKPTAWPALLCLQRSSTPLCHRTLYVSTFTPRPLYDYGFTLNPLRHPLRSTLDPLRTRIMEPGLDPLRQKLYALYVEPSTPLRSTLDPLR